MNEIRYLTQIAKIKRKNILFARYEDKYIAMDLDESMCYTFDNYKSVENWLRERL